MHLARDRTVSFRVEIERQHTARIPFERWCATITGPRAIGIDQYVFAMTRRGLDRAITRRIRALRRDADQRNQVFVIDEEQLR